MDQQTIGSVLIFWLGIITIFNLFMVVNMARKEQEPGSTLALGTAIFVFFGTAISTIWIWRQLS